MSVISRNPFLLLDGESRNSLRYLRILRLYLY